VWDGIISDKEAGDDVTTRAGAQHGVARVSKRLVPRSCIAKMLAVTRTLSNYHKEVTLPWTYDGIGIMAVEDYSAFMEVVRAAKTDLATALDEFKPAYPRIVTAQRERLGKLFHEDEYPTFDYIAERFTIDSFILPLPVSGDLRVSLTAEDYEEAKESVRRELRAPLSVGVKSLWGRLAEVLTTISERLSDDRSVVKDAIFKHARRACEAVAKLNFFGDEELEAVRQEVEAKFVTANPGEIRSNIEVKRVKAEQARDLLTRVSKYAP